MVSGAWIKCCQRRENTVSECYWEIRKMQVTTKRLGIIFHYRDEVYKGAIWVNCGQKNQQWKTLRKNGQQTVVTFQSGFIINRLQEMHAGIASTLCKLNWGSINVFFLLAAQHFLLFLCLFFLRCGYYELSFQVIRVFSQLSLD